MCSAESHESTVVLNPGETGKHLVWFCYFCLVIICGDFRRTLSVHHCFCYNLPDIRQSEVVFVCSCVILLAGMSVDQINQVDAINNNMNAVDNNSKGLRNPWISNVDSFHEKMVINKSDSILPSVTPK